MTVSQNSELFFSYLIVCKLVTSSSKLSCLAASFSMLISARLSRRSCAIDERKYDFMSLSFEKLRSALETMTGSVQNRIHAVPSSGIDDRTSDDSSRVRISLTDSLFSISWRNSRRNDLTSETRASPKSLSTPFADFGPRFRDVHQTISTKHLEIKNWISRQRSAVLQIATRAGL
jgi:hypothetical protein